MPTRCLFLLFMLCFSLMGAAREAAAQSCLSYDPAVVRLSGKITKVTFPGPPNYESVKKGDQPEVAWVLRLGKPVCVLAGQDNEFDVAEKGVTDIQLVLEPEEFTRWRTLARARVPVIITGKLFHAHTGHHHTAVLMEVTDIKRQN